MHDAQFNIQGIQCPEVRAQAQAFLEEIVQLCPSDSTVRVSLRRLHNRFIADFRVASATVRMHATDQATRLNDCLNHLQEKMLLQIVDWRSRRFAV